MNVEAWLNGPVPGVPPLLMPVAHSLLQAKQDLRAAASALNPEDLAVRPGGAASAGFHLRHIAGSADRLLTYALESPLSDVQLVALSREPDESGASAGELLDVIDDVLDRVLDVVRRTREQELTAVRYVGRARVPSTLIGLLFHIAEHTQRHTGQVITTAKILRASGHDTA